MVDIVAQRPGSVTFLFAGRIEAETFADFISDRAGRLGLAVGHCRVDTSRAQVTVTGQPAFVDAFEMACSLGPADSLVHSVSRSVDANLCQVIA